MPAGDGQIAVDLARERAFALGGLAVSPSTREVRFDAGLEILQPRIMQVLVALARRRGEVVSRDDLVDACWGGRVVGDDAINRCIQAIRRLADERGGFSVATVARVGYRLIEDVARPVADSPEPPPAPSAGPQTERRRLTVLSCNLVRDPGVAPLDPEERLALERPYRRAVTEAVARYGGYLVRGVGDDMMAYFGYPEAREDAAERAVRAGLAIVETLGARNASSAVRLAVRLGVHAGMVVITQDGREIEMFGEAPDLAARVQAAAPPDIVAVTGAVQDLVAGLFEMEPLPATAAGEQPVAVFRAVAPTARRGRGFAARELTPFVGREDEVHLLASRWKRARQGDGQLVLLTGEAGIGKTRLVQEFHKSLQGDAHIWLECTGERLISNTPFHAVARMVDQGLSWRGDETPQERLEALEAALGRAGLRLDEAIPLMGELLNLDLPPAYPPLSLPPDQKRRRLLACLAAWVLNLARNRPVIVLLEDLHWADPSSLELLQMLVEQAATSAIMMLCTARPEFHAGWTMRSHHVQLTLDRLSHEETRDLVVGVIAQAGLSDEVIDAVIRRTDGVPLFVEELTRLMLANGGQASDHGIPATLHDSLAARLDQLGPAKGVAQLAAVLGREFSFSLMAAVSPLSAEALQACLSQLTAAELLYVRGSPPEASYQFKHALILDVAYEALLKGRRRELHALVAHTMVERFPALAAAQPEVLARHWANAGEADKAIAAWVQAAETASVRHAYEEAVQSYRQALSVLATLPDTPERDAREMAIWLPISATVGLVHGHGSDEYRELHERGAALAEKSDSLNQLVLQMLVRFMNTFMSGHQRRAVEIADQLLSLARREGSDASLRLAEFSQIASRNGVGDHLGAEAHYLAWSEIVARSGHGGFVGEPAAAYGAGAETAFQLGRPDLAQERVDMAQAVARGADNPFEDAVCLMIEAWIGVLRREPAVVADAAIRALAISEPNGFTHVNQLRSCLAWAKAHLGETAEAVTLARSSLEGWVGGGFPRLPEARLVYGQVLARHGDHAEALAVFDSLCDTPVENVAVHAAHLTARGELLAEMGRIEPAEADLRAALDLAQGLQAKTLALRAATPLARLLRSRGDAADARALLAPIHASFAPGLDLADLRNAAALLDALALEASSPAA